MTETYSKSRLQAEIAFGHAQTESFANNSAVEELQSVAQTRDAKTFRLREARLAKEQAGRVSPTTALLANRAKASCPSHLLRSGYRLKNARNNELADRRSEAADAKAYLLKAYQAAKAASAPSQLVKHAERISLVQAREARRVERERLNLEECTRLEALAAEERAAIEAAAAAESEARNTAGDVRIARVVDDEAARKAERDRRYANRKARQA